METTTKYQPILIPLLSFIIGIFWQHFFSYNQIIILATTSFLLLLLIFFIRKKFDLKFLQILSCFLFFFGGALLLQAQKNTAQNLQEQIGNKRFDLIATVKEKDSVVDGKIKELLKIEVTGIKQKDQKEYTPVNFNLLCFTQTPTRAQFEDQIEVRNILISTQKATKATNLKSVSFNDYLIKENILATVFTKKLYFHKIDSPQFSISRWIMQKRDAIFKRLKSKISPHTFSYFSSIFLGNKRTKNMDEIRDIFNYWGLAHHLARAGLHISLFIIIWKFFLGLLPLAIYLKQIFLILICVTYQQLSWTHIPFVRAFYIFLFYELGKLFNFQTNFLHLLTLLCLIILMFNPIQLLFLDFQLSFAVTFALGWIAHINRIQKNHSK